MNTTSIAPARPLAGRAPGGMWWVAWRQHRTLVLSGLGLMLVVAVAMVVFRLIYDARPPGGSRYADDNRFWLWLRLSLVVLPVGLGALGGTMVVGPERERGTTVFAFSQGVGRSRWYWTKCAVVVAPLTMGVLALGLLAQWVVTAPGLEPWSPFAVPDFQTNGTVPAILTLIAFGVGVPAGALLRSLAAALSLAFVLATVVTAALGYGAYVDLAPHDRVVTPVAQAYGVLPEGGYQVGYGYLDAAGRTVPVPSCPFDVGPSGSQADGDAAWQRCLTGAGVVASYVEYVAADRRTQVTLSLAGLGTVIAAAGFTLGWWRVRRRSL